MSRARRRIEISAGTAERVWVAFLILLTASGVSWTEASAQADMNFRAPFNSYEADGIPMACADMDGDGRRDIVTVGSSTVQVLLNRGGRDFETLPAVPYSGGATSLAVGDFDHDGALDLVIGTYSSNDFAMVFFGNGDGTFQPEVQVHGAHSTFEQESVAVGDFNRDGRDDFVTTAGSINGIKPVYIQTYLSTGVRSFTRVDGPVLTNHTGSRGIAVADFDHDLLLDICVADRDSLTVLAGLGNGGFSSTRVGADRLPTITYIPFGSFPHHVALGDLNGDGWTDVVLPTGSVGVIAVFLHSGQTQFSGMFGAYSSISMPPPGYHATYGVAIGDVTLDGTPDILVADGVNDHGVVVLPGLGNGTFSSPIGMRPRSSGVVPADLDGDGKLDVIGGGAGAISILWNIDGVLGASTQGPSPFVLGPFEDIFITELMDQNGDGIPDLVALKGRGDAPRVAVAPGLGNASYGPAVETPGGSAYSPATLGDINSDGLVDLLTPLDPDSFTPPTLYLGQEDGSFDSVQVFPDAATEERTALGDVDGDGWMDAVSTLFWDGYNPVQVRVRLGDGSGTLAAPVGVFDAASGQVRDLAVEDVNGDGQADVVLAQPPGLAVLPGSGAGDGPGAYGPPLTSTAGGYVLEDFRLGDLNGDGRLDAVAVCTDSVTFFAGTLITMLGDGNGRFLTPAVVDSGIDPGSGYVGFGGRLILDDLNADGKLDVAYVPISSWSGAADMVRVRSGRGDGTFAAPENLGIRTNLAGILMAGDVDLDGRADLVTFGGQDPYSSTHDVNTLRGANSPASPPPCTNCTVGDPGCPISAVSFGQVSFFGQRLPPVPDTEWGEFGFTLEPGNDPPCYLNLLLKNVSESRVGWVVRNAIVPATPGLAAAVAIFQLFDLRLIGVTRGAPLNSLKYRLCLSTEPWDEDPQFDGEFQEAPVEKAEIEAFGAGVGDESETLVPQVPIPWTPPKLKKAFPPRWDEKAVRRNVPHLEEELYMCGPVAAARSLLWMKNSGHLNFAEPYASMSPAALAGALITWMKQAATWNDAKGGVPDPAHFLDAKLSLNAHFGTDLYNKFLRVANSNIMSLDENEHHVDGQKHVALNEGANKDAFAFIKREICEDEDVEMQVGWLADGNRNGGHWVTVIGYAEDEANGIRDIHVQTDMKQGKPSDLGDKRCRCRFHPSKGNKPPRLGLFPANQMEVIVSESQTIKPTFDPARREVTWGGGKFRDWTVQVPGGREVRIPWGLNGGLEHPKYAPFEFSNPGGPKKSIVYFTPEVIDTTRPNSILSLTVEPKKIGAKPGRTKAKAANMKRHSPWRIQPLESLPAGTFRFPILGAAGDDSTAFLFTAVNLDLFISSNPSGFPATWDIGDILGALGLTVVDGQISDLAGVYFATEEFVFDSLSATGFVPENGAAGWLQSATFEALHGPIEVAGSVGGGATPTDVPVAARPAYHGLRAAYPNPSHAGVVIAYSLDRRDAVHIDIVDISGRLIRTLLNRDGVDPGDYEAAWDGRDDAGRRVAGNVYFVTLTTSQGKTSRKVMVTR